MISGLLLLNKPAGISSTKAGALVKRRLGVKKLGHVGTLDPFATGLLPLAIGRATAVVRYMDDYDKRYRVRCRLGRTTDSLDLTGQTTCIKTPDTKVLEELLADEAKLIRSHLKSLTGDLEQVPPLHSAIKIGGKRLYEYAHRGEEAPDIPCRSVKIYRAELLAYQLDAAGDKDAPLFLDLDISCSKGTYIRSFCAQLGERLGFPAYAECLERVEVGPFTIEEAVNLEEVKPEMQLLSPDRALYGMTVLEFSLSDVDRFLCGLKVAVEAYLAQFNLTEDKDKLFVIHAENGTAGTCRLAQDESGRYFFVVERMFSDRERYFKREA